MTIDWSSVQDAMDRRAELRKLPPDMLASYAADMGERVAQLEEDVAALEQTLTDTEQRQEYVAVPVRWRLVRPGDVIVAKDGALLPVLGVERGGPWVLHLQNSDLRTSDPDRAVPVLMAREERDALKLLRRGLGAVITER